MYNLDIVIVVALIIALVCVVAIALDQRSQLKATRRALHFTQSLYNEAHDERMYLRSAVDRSAPAERWASGIWQSDRHTL